MYILHNRIQCRKCGDIIESESVHDFKFCKCGAVAVDGGHEYMKRSAMSLLDFQDLSEIVSTPPERGQIFVEPIVQRPPQESGETDPAG